MIKVEEINGLTVVTITFDADATASIRGVAEYGKDEDAIEQKYRLEAGAEAVKAIQEEERDLRGIPRPVKTPVEMRDEAARMEALENQEFGGDLDGVVFEIVAEKVMKEELAKREAIEAIE